MSYQVPAHISRFGPTREIALSFDDDRDLHQDGDGDGGRVADKLQRDSLIQAEVGFDLDPHKVARLAGLNNAERQVYWSWLDDTPRSRMARELKMKPQQVDRVLAGVLVKLRAVADQIEPTSDSRFLIARQRLAGRAVVDMPIVDETVLEIIAAERLELVSLQ